MVSIAFTGGGSGGHIYPGLAAAFYIKKQIACRIFWIGSDAEKFRSAVEKAGFEFFGIPAGKLRRRFSLQNFADLFKVAAGFFAARRILKREKPALLFSKGGFVSVPPCAAAASLGIPVFTHESDLSPGLATKINIRFAKRIFVPYEEALAFFPPSFRGRITVSGNPIRPEFRGADPAKGRAFLGAAGEDRILLVLGGSQGAREVNELVRGSLPKLTELFFVVHQTGPLNDWELKPTDRYKPYPFIQEELPHVIAAADIVMGRSGAGTLWENAALGRPMVLIPLSGSGTRGDQVENARYFERAGAAAVLLGKAASPENLIQLLAALAGDETRRKAMAAASARIGARDGAALIAGAVIEALGEQP
ncbi:MAG: undecaprenyldiphospho-muramoylpentapeptide beta-N-acetylglucosaminyltransferase [Treponema sp.]|jgi:UDP-N-acetylglucosamine--N-acetylmuramyl-(pentapeptide) pyrophosphoryl-undecaprenol N-acetylglucosamine transferase|nr:undecaprenyldiphospho-muramoylpentapeptide beta-N-acetylglucosaminyltransferase [Treponema sp.]